MAGCRFGAGRRFSGEKLCTGSFSFCDVGFKVDEEVAFGVGFGVVFALAIILVGDLYQHSRKASAAFCCRASW